MSSHFFSNKKLTKQLSCLIGVSIISTLSLLSEAANIIVNVDDSQQFQQMEGVGASFTDSAAWMVSDTGAILTPAARQQLMIDLFDPVNGIGLSLLRQPMGTSDFRWEDYTYNDIPTDETDFGLSNFSVARDDTYIIPMVQEAIAVNPNINVLALPWSAPAWMKDNASLYQGSLIDSEQIYDSYADYFVKFVRNNCINIIIIISDTLIAWQPS